VPMQMVVEWRKIKSRHVNGIGKLQNKEMLQLKISYENGVRGKGVKEDR
jgi:hypothetical protein